MNGNDIGFNLQDFAPAIGKVERFMSSMSSVASNIKSFSTNGLDLNGAEQEIEGISSNLSNLVDSSSEISEIRSSLINMLMILDEEDFKKIFEGNGYLENIDFILEGLFESLDSYEYVLRENSNELKELSDKIEDLNSQKNQILGIRGGVPESYKANLDRIEGEILELQKQYEGLIGATSIIKVFRDNCFAYTYSLYSKVDDFTEKSQSKIVSTNLKWDNYYQQFYVTIEGNKYYYNASLDLSKIEYYDENGNKLDANAFEIAQYFSKNEILVNNDFFSIMTYMDKDTIDYYNAIQNNYITEEEIGILTYLRNIENNDRLAQYENFELDLIEQRHGMELASKVISDCEDVFKEIGTVKYSSGMPHPFTEREANAQVSAIMAGAGLADGLNNFFNGISNLFTADGKVSADEYKAQYLLSYLKEKYEKDKIMEIISTSSYEIASSIGNMLPSVAVSYIPGMQFAGLGLMGASATGNAREQGLQMGMTNGGAWLYGALNGLSEAGLQYFLGGISKLSSGNSAKSLSKLFKMPGFAAGLLSEGTEESLQAVLDPLFKTIATNGAIPYEVDWAEVLKSGIYGMITAGIMNGSSTMLAITINGINYNIDSSKINELIEKFKNEDLTEEKVQENLEKYIQNNSEKSDFDGKKLKKEIIEELNLSRFSDEMISNLSLKLGFDIDTTKTLLIARQLYYSLNQRVNYDANYYFGSEIKDIGDYSISSDAMYYINYFYDATNKKLAFDDLDSESVVCRGWRDLMKELLISSGIPKETILEVGSGHYWLKVKLPNGMDLVLDSTEYFEDGDDLANCKAGVQTKGFVIWPEDVGWHRLRNFSKYYGEEKVSQITEHNNRINNLLDENLQIKNSNDYLELLFSEELLNVDDTNSPINDIIYNFNIPENMDGLDAYYYYKMLKESNPNIDFEVNYYADEVKPGKADYILIFKSPELSYKYSKSQGYFDIK